VDVATVTSCGEMVTLRSMSRASMQVCPGLGSRAMAAEAHSPTRTKKQTPWRMRNLVGSSRHEPYAQSSRRAILGSEGRRAGSPIFCFAVRPGRGTQRARCKYGHIRHGAFRQNLNLPSRARHDVWIYRFTVFLGLSCGWIVRILGCESRARKLLGEATVPPSGASDGALLRPRQSGGQSACDAGIAASGDVLFHCISVNPGGIRITGVNHDQTLCSS